MATGEYIRANLDLSLACSLRPWHLIVRFLVSRLMWARVSDVTTES